MHRQASVHALKKNDDRACQMSSFVVNGLLFSRTGVNEQTKTLDNLIIKTDRKGLHFSIQGYGSLSGSTGNGTAHAARIIGEEPSSSV
jgi:hypothetical protein